jgi:hypothetical protein
LVAQGDLTAVPDAQFLFQRQRRDDLDYVPTVGLPGEAFGLGQYRRGRFAVNGQRQRSCRAEIRRRRGDLNSLFGCRQAQRRQGRRVGAQVQCAGKRRVAQLLPALPGDPVQAGEVGTLAQAGEDRALYVNPLCNCPNPRRLL